MRPRLHPAVLARVGTTIGGKYRLLRLLGSGSFAAVYDAQHSWTERRVAIKVLHPTVSTNEHVLRRFKQEARIATQLAHPNIVDVLDMGQDEVDGSFFIVQELLEGETLADRLHREGVLAPSAAADVLVPIMGALAAAHGTGVIHRDVKPANIFLVDQPSGRPVPMLIDFGVSKVQDSTDHAHRTRTGAMIGTPQYMAPEQARGDKTIDHRADIWAVGVSFYEVLTGVCPYDGPNYNAVIVAIVTADAVPIEQLRPEIGADVARVVARAMERDRDRRFATMRDFIQAVLECPSIAGRDTAALAARYHDSLSPPEVDGDPTNVEARDIEGTVDAVPVEDAAYARSTERDPIPAPRASQPLIEEIEADDPSRRPVGLETVRRPYPAEVISEELFASLRERVARDPNDAEALARLRAALVARGDFAGLVELLRDVLGRLRGRGDRDREYELWRALGVACYEHLQRPDDALEAFRMAARLRPRDTGPHRTLARLCEAVDDPVGALRHWADVLALDAQNAQAYAAMFDIHLRAREPDRAFCVASVMASLLPAETRPDIRAFYERHRPLVAPLPRTRLDKDQWTEELAHSSQDPFVGSVLATVTPALRRLRAAALADYGFEPAQMHDFATSPLPMVHALRVAVGALDVRVRPTIVVAPERCRGLEHLRSEPVASALGAEDLCASSAAEMLFLAGRHAAFYRAGHYAAVLLPSAGVLAPYFHAAVAVAEPAHGVDDAARALVPVLRAQLEARPNDLKALRRLVQMLFDPSQAPDLAAWLAAVELTACRAGFLLSGDLDATRRLLDSDLARPLVAQPMDRFREVVRFAVSEEYFRLREGLGLRLAIEAS